MDIKELRIDQARILLEADEVYKCTVRAIMDSVDDKEILKEAELYKQNLTEYWKKLLERKMKQYI
jgi:hypothetical protein